MNACLRSPTQKPGEGAKKHTQRFVGTHQTVPTKRRKREGGRDLKSVAGREINGTAQHKSKSKVLSSLSGIANVTVVSSQYKCETKHAD